MNAQTDDAGNRLIAPMVNAGAMKSAKNYPRIEITFDDEREIHIPVPKGGFVNLWIDIWMRTDSPDPAVAYELQDGVQEQILSVLPAWPKQVLEEIGIACKVNVQDIVSDGDQNRPAIGARIVLEIEWRNYNGK